MQPRVRKCPENSPAPVCAGHPRNLLNPHKVVNPHKVLNTAALIALLSQSVLPSHAASRERASDPVGPIEEILVTAELRATPWLEQAASTTVIDAGQAKKRSAAHLENLLQIAPNVNFAGGSSRARFFQLRGIGERSQFVEALNPSVGLLIDNIDFSGLGTIAGAYDIEQVEILRGPQGTLHGANALAGLINLRSAPPDEDFSTRLNGILGNFGRRELGLSIGGPLGAPGLLSRASVFRHRSDGFVDNGFLKRDDTNARDELSFRGKLRWRAGERQSLDLALIYADADNGYDAFSLDNTRTTLSDEPGRDRQESEALGLNYRVASERVSLELSGSAAQSDSEYSFDVDWGFVGIAPGEYSAFDRYLRKRRSYSLQARLASTEPLPLSARGMPGAGGLHWTLGLYGLKDDETLRREYTFLREDFSSRLRAETAAVYGQIDYEIGPRWNLSAGLRLARRAMDYRDSRRVNGQPGNELWGGKLAVQYFSENSGMFYASASRGYRAGGVNAQILAFPARDNPTGGGLAARRFFEDELLYNYEIGHKGRFFAGRARSSLALFFMDRKDQQVRGSLLIPRGDNSTTFIDFTDNAASGFNLGLEWELRATASEVLELYFNLGLLRAEFEDYINADGRDLRGRDQAQAPAWQFAAGLTYRLSEKLSLDLNWEGKDAFFWSDRHDERSGAFALWHGRIAYRTAGWELALWGRNLFDKDFFLRGFGSFGNDPRKGYITEEYLQFGEPRHLGVSFEYRL